MFVTYITCSLIKCYGHMNFLLRVKLAFGLGSQDKSTDHKRNPKADR